MSTCGLIYSHIYIHSLCSAFVGSLTGAVPGCITRVRRTDKVEKTEKTEKTKRKKKNPKRSIEKIDQTDDNAEKALDVSVGEKLMRQTIT